MAKELLVITLLSEDKPGIVKQVADVISQHQGNWLESRMSQLAGKFAGILKINIEKNDAEKLIDALKDLEKSGIQFLIDHVSENAQPTSHLSFSFELVGADRIGIISEISQAFSDKGINIDEMETECSSMPWSGEPLFQASGLLSAPTETNTDDLLHQLDAIEEKLGVDITLTTTL
jgi:glycine cleavage system regulatory protein